MRLRINGLDKCSTDSSAGFTMAIVPAPKSFAVMPGAVSDDELLEAVARAAQLHDPPRTEHVVSALGPCFGDLVWNEQSCAQRLSTLADQGRLRRHGMRAPAGRSAVMHWALP